MKKITILFLLISVYVHSQQQLNTYKYVIVPKKFDTFNTENKYRTSSITKFLLNKTKGFTVLFSDDVYPQDLIQNPCLGLKTNLKDASGLFSTKVNIEFKNCKNKIVYITPDGRSKIKELKRAYQEAIRNSLKSLNSFNYKFEESKQEKISTINKKKQKVVKSSAISDDTYQVKLVSNGFELLNSKNTIDFELLKTDKKDVYIVKDINGILYKNNQIWILEYYEGTNKILKELTLNF